MIDRRGVIGGGAALAAAGLVPLRALAADGPVVNHIVVEDGRVWIAAMVNGKGPHFFIVDTGGVLSLIYDGVAKEMGLDQVPGRQMVGLGGKVADYSWYSAREVRLASGTRFTNMLFAGMGRKLGEAVGAFGAGLFTTYDSDFDFVKGEWRAYPGGRPDFDGLTRLPGRFDKGSGADRIELDATIDGHEVQCIADTGAPGLSLNGRAARNSGLWESGKPYAPVRAFGIGDGDGVAARLYRTRELKIGQLVFNDLLVNVSAPGTLSGGGQDGLIGLNVLSQLHLSTDVSAGALYAARNSIQAPRQTYPLSGLWIDEVKGKLVVGDVGIGSPAAKAGVRTGDVLVGGEFRAMLRAIGGPPGKAVTLKIERSGAQQDVSYTLAPWF